MRFCNQCTEIWMSDVNNVPRGFLLPGIYSCVASPTLSRADLHYPVDTAEMTSCEFWGQDTEITVASAMLSQATWSREDQMPSHRDAQPILWKGPGGKETQVTSYQQQEPTWQASWPCHLGSRSLRPSEVPAKPSSNSSLPSSLLQTNSWDSDPGT